MANHANEKSLLASSIYVPACIRTDLKEVRRRMSALPNCRLVSTGTALKYAYEAPNGQNSKALIELSASEIILTFYHHRQTSHSRNLDLVRLLSVLAFLNGAYTVGLDALYPALVEALSSPLLNIGDGQIAESTVAKERIEALSSANLLLSHEASKFAKLHGLSEQKKEVYRSSCVEIIEKLTRNGVADQKSACDALRGIGVGAATVEKLMECIGSENRFRDRK